jgi:nucleotide-binding universal stress UspA family protein
LNAELDNWASDILANAVEAVPGEVVSRRVQGRGDAGHDDLERAQARKLLLVLGTRGRGRAQEGLLGSVNG